MSFPVASNTALSPQQWTFLEENFQVLDPKTGETSLDFSGLLKCKTILMGEFHHTYCLHKVQVEFLKLFCNGKTLLASEGLAPGAVIDITKVVRYGEYPGNVEVIGADIRGETPDKFVNLINLNWELTQRHKELMDMVQIENQEVAAIFSQAIYSGKLYLSDGELFAKEDVLVQVFSNSDSHAQPKKTLLNRISQLRQQIKDLSEAWNCRALESNQGLCKEVKKAQCDYEKIIAIWGRSHFYGFSDLWAELGVYRHDYIILMPSIRLEEKFVLEDEVAKNKTVIATLQMHRESGGINTFSIPRQFVSYYHPLVRKKIIIPPEVKPLNVDGAGLLNLFRDRETIEFLPDQLIALFGVSEGVHQLLLDESADIPVLVAEAFNDLVVFLQASINVTIRGRVQAYSRIYNGKNNLIVTGAKLELTVNRTFLYIEPISLFKEMKRRSVRSYTWKKGVSLGIIGLDQSFLQKTNEVVPWFKKLGAHLNGSVALNRIVIENECKGMALTALADSSFVLGDS